MQTAKLDQIVRQGHPQLLKAVEKRDHPWQAAHFSSSVLVLDSKISFTPRSEKPAMRRSSVSAFISFTSKNQPSGREHQYPHSEPPKSFVCRMYLFLGLVQSQTISSMVLPDPMLFGCSSRMLLSMTLSANESASFESVQIGRGAFLFVLVSVQPPFSFSP